jgi:hypothetical protein
MVHSSYATQSGALFVGLMSRSREIHYAVPQCTELPSVKFKHVYIVHYFFFGLVIRDVALPHLVSYVPAPLSSFPSSH